MPMINLQSSDGEVFQVDFEIAKVSVTIKTMIENLGLKENDEEIIPLTKVSSSILKKVIMWATYHKDDPLPLQDEEQAGKRTNNISTWDLNFFKVDQSTLFGIIMAANYLEIKGLLDTGCKTVANMMKDKNPDQIRNLFNIKNDFTAAEEAEIRKQNEWCMEH